MKRAVVPGSFDPVTKGHIDIVKRAANLFDEVLVVVLNNPSKKCTFSVEQRVDFLRRATADIPNVKADSYDGLLVDYMDEKEAVAIVKGLRAVSDFEYEFQMSLTNKRLNPNVETLFLNTNQEFMYLSSSVVRQVASFGRDISEFIPEAIIDDVRKGLSKGE